jgi:hypothetical protein
MELRRVVEGMYMDKKPIAAVEHGTCALVHACVREAGHPHQGKSILYDRQARALFLQLQPNSTRNCGCNFFLALVHASASSLATCPFARAATNLKTEVLFALTFPGYVYFTCSLVLQLYMQVTGVSNRTEVKLDRSSVVPFLLEDRIKQARTL